MSARNPITVFTHLEYRIMSAVLALGADDAFGSRILAKAQAHSVQQIFSINRISIYSALRSLERSGFLRSTHRVGLFKGDNQQSLAAWIRQGRKTTTYEVTTKGLISLLRSRVLFEELAKVEWVEPVSAGSLPNVPEQTSPVEPA